MGIAPSEVLAMPLHDYQAAMHHYAAANGSEQDDDHLGDDDFDDMLKALH